MSGLGQKIGELSGSDEGSAREKRRTRSASEKQRIVEASFKPGASVKAVAEAHDVHPTQLYKWRRLYERNAEDKSGGGLLPVRVAEESAGHREPRSAFKKPEAMRFVTIHLEFTNARVRIESADCATVLAVLEQLAR